MGGGGAGLFGLLGTGVGEGVGDGVPFSNSMMCLSMVVLTLLLSEGDFYAEFSFVNLA